MKQKPKSKGSSDKKIMDKVLDILRKRSIKSIKLAQAQILSMKLESKKAQEALKHYAKNLDDITHPGILSLACETVGGKPNEAIPMQVIMLLLTAAMDIHDDIIDQTNIKNGKLTIYGKFGRDVALLIGDSLFLRGFALLERSGANLPSESFKAIVQTVENSFFDVGNAHLLEIDFKRKLNITPDTYLRILERKASIIGGHAKIGAIIGKGSTSEIEALGNYGKLLGTLIAIREEFIDIFEIDELRNRIECGCLPLPILYAFDNPQAKNTILALTSSMSKNSDEEVIKKLVDIVFRDKNVKKLRELMQNLSKQALSTVNQLQLRLRVESEIKLLTLGTLEDL